MEIENNSLTKKVIKSIERQLDITMEEEGANNLIQELTAEFKEQKKTMSIYLHGTKIDDTELYINGITGFQKVTSIPHEEEIHLLNLSPDQRNPLNYIAHNSQALNNHF